MKSTRFAVTVRFTQTERANLRSLADFFNLDERRVLKLAFQQLALATEQLQTKLKKEKSDVKDTDVLPDSSVDSVPVLAVADAGQQPGDSAASVPDPESATD